MVSTRSVDSTVTLVWIRFKSGSKTLALWDELNSGDRSARKLLKTCWYLYGPAASLVDITLSRLRYHVQHYVWQKNNSFRSHHIYSIKVMTNRTQCLYALLNTSIKFSFIASTLEVYRNDFDLVSKGLCIETDQKLVRFWKLFSQTVFQKLISLSVLINLLPVLAICTFFCICYVIEMILHCLNWFFYISVNLFTIFVKCLNLAKICDRVPLNTNRKGKVR